MTTQSITLPHLVGASSLVAVDVVRVHSEREHADQIGGELVTPADMRVDVRLDTAHPKQSSSTAASFVCVVNCGWHTGGAPTATPPPPLAGLSVTVRVAYAFGGLTEAPDEALLAAFSTQVAVHHAWPFLRERVRTLSVELGLPPLVLPLRHLSNGPQPGGLVAQAQKP